MVCALYLLTARSPPFFTMRNAGRG